MTPSVEMRVPLDVISSIAGCFDDSAYLRENPDIAEAMARGQVDAAFSHFLRFGLGERRRFALRADAAPPLAIAPVLIATGQFDAAVSVYERHLRAVIANAVASRPIDPRFDLYAGCPGLLAEEFEQRDAFPAPQVSEPDSGDDVWAAVIAHRAIASGEIGGPLLAAALGCCVGYPSPAADRFLAVIAATLGRGLPRYPSDLLLRAYLRTRRDTTPIDRRHDGLPWLAAADASLSSESSRGFNLLACLAVGNWASAAGLVDRFASPTRFERLLQAIGDVEVIARADFTTRPESCHARIARLDRVLDSLDAGTGNGAATLYVAGRAAFLKGRFDRAVACFRQAQGIRPDFIHAQVAEAEAQLHLGDVAGALRTTERTASAWHSPDIQRIAAHLRHWTDMDATRYAYVPAIVGDRCLERDPPPLASGLDARLAGVPVADHDFVLALRVAIAADAIRDAPLHLFRNEAGFVLELEADARAMTARLGDGAAWIAEVAMPLPSGGASHLLHMRRSGGRLELYLDRELIRAVALPRGYWLRGDTWIAAHPLAPHHGTAVRVAFFWEVGLYPAEPPPAEVTFVSMFWGQGYADLFQRVMLPSLVKLGGLRSIAGKRPARIEIYAPGREIAAIAPSIALLRKLPIEVVLRTDFLSDEEHLNRSLLDDCLRHVWDAHERRRCMTVFAQPDHVFGEGLATLIDGFSANDYVVCGHPRVARETGVEAIAGRLAAGHFRGNGDLVAYTAGAHPHATFRTGLANPQEGWINARRESDRYVVRFKEPPPLLIQARKDGLGVLTGSPYGATFEQIDHDIVDVVERQGRLKVVNDSRQFFWAEFSSDQKNVPTIRNSYWSRAARRLARQELHWHLDL